MEVELERQPQRTKVSCPHCQKAYLIFLSDLQEETNRFVCKQCKEDFWIRKSDLEMVSTIGQRQEKCPKCGHSVKSLDRECESCGVIGAKFQALRDHTPYLKVSDSLKGLWKRVLNHYDDERVHHEFLSQCLKENQLRYASLQYKQLKEAVGSDEIVSQMMKKIQTLTQMDFEKSSGKSDSRKKDHSYPQYVRYFRWEGLLFAVGLAFVLSGLASPVMRNLISIGVVFMALPVLIRVFFPR